MLGIIVATTLIALILNLILKKVHLPTIIGYILTGTIIAYTFDFYQLLFQTALARFHLRVDTPDVWKLWALAANPICLIFPSQTRG